MFNLLAITLGIVGLIVFVLVWFKRESDSLAAYDAVMHSRITEMQKENNNA